MVVTVDKLARAIVKRLEVPEAEAGSFSERVMNYFGFEKYVLDNAIHQDDRRLFYRLQEAGLLKTSWETTLLLTGRSWRIFYWEISETDLDRTLLGEPVNPPEVATYADLPDEAWTHPPPPG